MTQPSQYIYIDSINSEWRILLFFKMIIDSHWECGPARVSYAESRFHCCVVCWGCIGLFENLLIIVFHYYIIHIIILIYIKCIILCLIYNILFIRQVLWLPAVDVTPPSFITPLGVCQKPLPHASGIFLNSKHLICQKCFLFPLRPGLGPFLRFLNRAKGV